MEIMLNKENGYVVCSISVFGQDDEDNKVVTLNLTPRDGSNTISLTIERDNWLRLVASTAMALLGMED